MSSNMRIEKTCQYCGKRFIAKTTVTKFCSHQCASRNYKKQKREKKLQKAMNKQTEQNDSITTLQQREFLSIKETARLIGTSRSTICRLLNKGELDAGKVASRTIIKRTAIEKLFE